MLTRLPDAGHVRCRLELEIAFWLRDYGRHEDDALVEALAARAIEHVLRDCRLAYPLDWTVRLWARAVVQAWAEESHGPAAVAD